MIPDISLRRLVEEALGHTERLDLGSSAVTIRAYANWGKPQLSRIKRELDRTAVEAINVHAMHEPVKNAADIELIVDAMEMAFTQPAIETFVIVSCDGGYIPLARRLRRQGKFVLAASLDRPNLRMSEGLRNNVDHVIELRISDTAPKAPVPEQIPRPAGRASAEQSSSPALLEVGRALEKVLREDRRFMVNQDDLDGRLLGSLAQRIRAHQPFDSQTLGFKNFAALLEKGLHRSIVRPDAPSGPSASVTDSPTTLLPVLDATRMKALLEQLFEANPHFATKTAVGYAVRQQHLTTISLELRRSWHLDWKSLGAANLSQFLRRELQCELVPIEQPGSPAESSSAATQSGAAARESYADAIHAVCQPGGRLYEVVDMTGNRGLDMQTAAPLVREMTGVDPAGLGFGSLTTALRYALAGTRLAVTHDSQRRKIMHERYAYDTRMPYLFEVDLAAPNLVRDAFLRIGEPLVLPGNGDLATVVRQAIHHRDFADRVDFVSTVSGETGLPLQTVGVAYDVLTAAGSLQGVAAVEFIDDEAHEAIARCWAYCRAVASEIGWPISTSALETLLGTAESADVGTVA
ncbi:NYN domain-containing protein [Rathayibacter sp. ZW T2_19]|uniref:NYN domain-containing protein n=1 Tax=Rathayibacter rubneri TaxID=2950106 RepID=A0A9X2IRU0_9MICO|nr:NYN domain-containing protein [Rathayibacter rubneri]